MTGKGRGTWPPYQEIMRRIGKLPFHAARVNGRTPGGRRLPAHLHIAVAQ